ncbi:carboxylate--amine ligase, partial [Micromonospora aurantiaca]|nr:carboxylate--amine ligase [Micromonospora aurantiaca]
MAIDFNASSGATLGVEWELQLVDAETRHLRQDAREVLADLPSLSLDGDNPRIRHELMESMVEIVTGICSTVGEAKADLAGTLGALRGAAADRGIALACTGTHPISDWRDAVTAPMGRYAQLVEEMQWLARRIQTFGVHVHVGISDGAKAIPIVNALSSYLPHFLALTASSPFWSAG